MTTPDRIESACRPERAPATTYKDISDIHLTHLGRGLPAAEQAERRRAARHVVRHAVHLGAAGAIDELLDAIGLTHADAIPEPAPDHRPAEPDPPPRRRAARWRDAKYCAGCEQVRPLAEFWRDRGRPDGYGSRCKGCRRRVRDANASTKTSTKTSKET